MVANVEGWKVGRSVVVHVSLPADSTADDDFESSLHADDYEDRRQKRRHQKHEHTRAQPEEVICLDCLLLFVSVSCVIWQSPYSVPSAAVLC